MFAMNERSILTVSRDMCRRSVNEHLPVPKSSIATFTPRVFRSFVVVISKPESEQRDSLISISSCSGRTRDSLRLSFSSPTMSALRICREERLIPTLGIVICARSHASICLRTSDVTHEPILTLRSIWSATGMNDGG